MFTLPNFCRVCLKYDKNLIDLAHIENEPNETLLSKLQLCVAEVEWETNKPLLCHPCIKRLNIAYSFKKQAVQSAGVLKNYIDLVKESQKKSESQATPEKPPSIVPPGGGAYMLLPNQKYVKILVGQNQQGTPNTFQNVFLNLIPNSTTSTLNMSNPPPLTITAATAQNKNNSNSKQDSNQNMFLNALNLGQAASVLNFSQAVQKLLPASVSIGQAQGRKFEKAKVKRQKEQENIEDMLNEENAEEMSVDIDPTSFLQVEHDAGSSDEDEEVGKDEKDWDNIITQQKVDPISKMNGEKMNGKEQNISIIPKQSIMQAQDFFSGQHFLTNSFESGQVQGHFGCGNCNKSFPTQKMLKNHMKKFHMGSSIDYEACKKLGLNMSVDSALRLADFEDDSMNDVNEADLLPNELGEFVCNICNRIFHTSPGLLTHKVRKHQQKNRKKYFIKGMKNARCDVCNREFSTHSYMLMHRKLHMRDDTGGYKFKVLGRSMYDMDDEEEVESKPMVNKRGRKPKDRSNEPPKVKGKRGRKRKIDILLASQEQEGTSNNNETNRKKVKSEQNEQNTPEGDSCSESSETSSSHNKNGSNATHQTDTSSKKIKTEEAEDENDSSSDSESDSSSSSSGSDSSDEDGETEVVKGESGEATQ